MLALLVSLDGDGTTTYMITVSAMLPLYRHLELDVALYGVRHHHGGGCHQFIALGRPDGACRQRFEKLDPALCVPAGGARHAGGAAFWVLVVAWWFEDRRGACGLRR